MRQIIKIDDIGVEMEASADTPRAYREFFGEDIFVGLARMTEGLDMNVIENLAFIMARACDPDLSDIHEWLRQFSAMGISRASVQIMRLWNGNTKTTSKSGKK